jgi:polyisoprenoid-binding protein YceI
MTSVYPVLEPAENLVPRLDGGVYLIDTLRSRVAFSVRHLTGRVQGVFTRFSGTVYHDPSKPEVTTARVTIQTASVLTHNDVRDARLRSSGFLAVRAFPNMTFVSTAARRAGRKLEVSGELTLHGVSCPMTITVGRTRTSSERASNMSASARALLRRSNHGVGPSSRLESGGLLISDEVSIELDLELVRQ